MEQELKIKQEQLNREVRTHFEKLKKALVAREAELLKEIEKESLQEELTIKSNKLKEKLRLKGLILGEEAVREIAEHKGHISRLIT